MMKSCRHVWHGFTLVEMVVVITLIGILVAATVPVAVSWGRAYNANRNTTVMLDKLNYALARITHELREAGVDGQNSSTLNMSTTAPSFKRTEYPAGVAITRQVTIGQDSGVVTLSYDTPSVTPAPALVDQLNSLEFSYYDRSGAATTSAANVCYVGIALTLAQGAQTYTQRTRVRLRNQNEGCSIS